jgi:cell division protein FtsN
MAKSSPRGASRQGGSGRQLPGWLWLFTGLVAGLFIAFLYHLAQVQKQEPVAKTTTHQSSSAKTPNKSSLPKFDFYAVLPKMEVILPKEDNSQTSQPSQKGAAGTPAGQGKYLLQAGSFRDKADAEKLRAEFTLDGFSVHVQPGVLDNGDTWYRVMIGPFNDEAALRTAQTRLAARNVETLPIQVTGK